MMVNIERILKKVQQRIHFFAKCLGKKLNLHCKCSISCIIDEEWILEQVDNFFYPFMKIPFGLENNSLK